MTKWKAEREKGGRETETHRDRDRQIEMRRSVCRHTHICLDSVLDFVGHVNHVIAVE